jgi:hypothetical protein
MNGETQDRPKASSRGASWGWIWWLGVIAAVYVLSIGPVAMMGEKKRIGPNTPGFRVLVIVYAPVEWAAEKLPPVRRPLGMYLHLWVPSRWDSKGTPYLPAVGIAKETPNRIPPAFGARDSGPRADGGCGRLCH